MFSLRVLYLFLFYYCFVLRFCLGELEVEGSSGGVMVCTRATRTRGTTTEGPSSCSATTSAATEGPSFCSAKATTQSRDASEAAVRTTTDAPDPASDINGERVCLTFTFTFDFGTWLTEKSLV